MNEPRQDEGAAASRRHQGFRITARTLFHLGADLISTDAMALYELVKNAFDAGSARVAIKVRMRVPVAIADALISRIAAACDEPDEEARAALFDDLHREAAESLSSWKGDEFAASLAAVEDAAALMGAYLPVNEIVVEDTGHGMTQSELRDVFLTVGTMSRRDELERRRTAGAPQGARPVLGEKGVGRLSTMRLGQRLLVETARTEDRRVNILDLDWSLFARRPDALLEDIAIGSSAGRPKTRDHGTDLRIRMLATDWTLDKLKEIARQEFARLNDPFETGSRFPIDLSFNGEAVPVPLFRSILLDEAHATVSASFGPSDPKRLLPNGRIGPEAPMRMRGSVDYRLRGRTLPIDLAGMHLTSAAGKGADTLRSLGPFEVRIYWYNRAILEQVDTIGDKRAVQRLVGEWSGGIMVYRDGFRVGAYGSGADDWLGLDRKALASGGYKVNRAQLIGRLGISSISNPSLVDQTNREGLRDSPEKDALVALLKHLLESVFRPFLDSVDKEVRAREPVDIKKLAERVLSQRRAIAETIRLVYERYPQVRSDPLIGGRIEEALKAIGETMRDIEDMGASYTKARTELTVLAGIGLSVATIAHDLRQVTQNALAAVDEMAVRRSKSDLSRALAPIGSQLKTLLTRLRVLDPLVTSGRQVKRRVRLIEWVPNIIETIAPTFDADDVVLRVRQSGSTTDGFEVNVVPGMVVQVTSNLLDNARYWVKRRRLENPAFRPLVDVEIDGRKREIRFSDNGPGIAESMRRTIFEAFVTTKPPGAGSGLGLFISNEIARYSGAELTLLDADDTAPGMSTTFALRFPKGPR